MQTPMSDVEIDDAFTFLEGQLAYRTTHVSKASYQAVPPAPSVRELIKRSKLQGRLATLLVYPELWWDLRLAPWVDHGVRDEEGIPTEFEPPSLQITIGVYPKAGGGCVLSDTIPASEAPILAAAVQDQIGALCFEQMRFVNQEIARFMDIVCNLQHQNSKLYALRGPTCTTASPS